ncbi:MAG: HEAT repeat domain-containing protein [bacterium]
MPVTLQDVVKQLDREEPNYAQAARLGAEALPYLAQLIEGDHPGLAAKAAFLAGSINVDDSARVLEIAARHPDPVVRVAAAASAKHLTHMTTSLATTFLQDADPGVRKWGLRTLEATYPAGVRPSVERIMTDDPDQGLREQARKMIDRLK